MGRFDTGEETGFGDGFALFVGREVVEFSAREGHAFSALFLSKDTNSAADGFGSSLVVTSDDDDTNTSLKCERKEKFSTIINCDRLVSFLYLTAAGDGIKDFLARGIQHTNNTNKGHVVFVGGKLGRVGNIHVGNFGRGIQSGQSKTTQSVATSTVLAGDFHNFVVNGRSHWHLLGSNANVATAIQDTFRGSFAEHFGSVSKAGALEGNAVRRHGFTVSGEFHGEILLPFSVHILADYNSRVTTVHANFADVVGIELLAEGDECRFSCLADLFKGLFVLVEIDGRVVAHHADGGDFVQSFEIAGADLSAVHADFANRFVS